MRARPFGRAWCQLTCPTSRTVASHRSVAARPVAARSVASHRSEVGCWAEESAAAHRPAGSAHLEAAAGLHPLPGAVADRDEQHEADEGSPAGEFVSTKMNFKNPKRRHAQAEEPHELVRRHRAHVHARHRARHREHPDDDQHDRQQAREHPEDGAAPLPHVEADAAADQILESPEIVRLPGEEAVEEEQDAPPASSFSAVDIFDMSKPDEPEPSIHCSFQPPRTRAAGCFSSGIQEATGARVKHPAWDGFGDDVGDAPATAIVPPVAATHGPHEAAWNVGGKAIASAEATAIAVPPTITRIDPARAGWVRNHHAAGSRAAAATTATIDQRTLGTHAPKSRSPAPVLVHGPTVASRASDGAGDRHPRPGDGSVGLWRRRDRRVAQFGGEALGTEHAASHRDRAREAHGLVASAASGDRGSARMMDAALVGRASRPSVAGWASRSGASSRAGEPASSARSGVP